MVARSTPYEVVASVTDPEMPMLTLEDLGVLRGVGVGDDGSVVVRLTPTYSGCPALAAMRDDVVRVLHEAGYADVRVDLVLEPAWSSDWITERGRRALAAYGISPPGAAPRRDGPVPLQLAPVRRALRCPRCGSDAVEATSEFGPTPCTALYRCAGCREPFEHVKEL